MKVFSEVTQCYYEPAECTFIVNLKQAGLYIKHEAKIYDVLWSKKYDHSGDDSDGKLVFVFNKKETKDLFDLWCRRELY